MASNNIAFVFFMVVIIMSTLIENREAIRTSTNESEDCPNEKYCYKACIDHHNPPGLCHELCSCNPPTKNQEIGAKDNRQ